MSSFPPSTPPPPPPVVSFTCGDGIVQAAERCDLGALNGQSGQNCTTTCQVFIPPACGNGNLETGEECDDSNVVRGDGCNAQCRIEYGKCGDGIANRALGEECDEGDRNGSTDADCDSNCKYVRLPRCGDGIVDAASEQCDSGRRNGNYQTTTCLDNCMLPYCGDGITESNEQCDDRNMLDGDGCDYACRFEVSPSSPIVAVIIPPNPSNPPSQPVEVIPANIPTPAKSEEGPGLAIFLASGAAAGIGLARRRLLKR